ncbi:unnamed protein product, partial [Pylaiella littoralis]
TKGRLVLLRSPIVLMRVPSLLSCACVLVVTAAVQVSGEPLNAGSKGCGITGMQYVIRNEEDVLSGALVSTTCRNSDCTDKEEYATGVLWARKY